MQIKFDLNGRSVEAAVDPRVTLADFLRDQTDATGTHLGCEHGVCGSCTVIVEGLAVRSCLTLAVQANGQRVTTVEGLAIEGSLSPLQQAFRKHHALQCGFCTPGILTTMHALLIENPFVEEEEIRDVLSGNICRCTGYIGSAVQKLGLDSSKPVVALRDTLAIVKPMLRGERVSYTGKAFSALNVGLDYRPRQNVPIFLAGRGDLTLQLCGESADGLLISNMCSREFAANAAGVVNAARAASGRSGRATIVQYMPCAVRETHFEAREAGRRAVGELVPGFWALSKKVASAKEGLVAGTGIDATEFERAAVAISGGADPVETLSDKFTDAFSLTGTPDECLAQAAKYAAAGITELALTFDGPGAIDQIRLLGSAFQRAG